MDAVSCTAIYPSLNPAIPTGSDAPVSSYAYGRRPEGCTVIPDDSHSSVSSFLLLSESLSSTRTLIGRILSKASAIPFARFAPYCSVQRSMIQEGIEYRSSGLFAVRIFSFSSSFLRTADRRTAFANPAALCPSASRTSHTDSSTAAASGTASI